jgi:hypothetical protein
LSAAVLGYLLVAFGMGLLPAVGAGECLAIALAALMLASHLAGRIGLPQASSEGGIPPAAWMFVLRTVIPAAYVTSVGIAAILAGPTWAGLVSMFPSMSTVLLAVTHLEEGPAEASLIARTLPPANLSTVVFLAAFRFGCPALGLGWATFWGYLAALINLVVIEMLAQGVIPVGLLPERRGQSANPTRVTRLLSNRAGLRRDDRPMHRPLGRMGPARRRHFAPLIEILPC